MGIISPIDIKLTGSSYWCVYVDIFWLVNMFVSLDLLQRTWVIYGCSWRCWRRRTHTTCSSRLKWKRSVDNVLFLYNYCQILKAFHDQMLLVKAEEKLGYFLCSLGISRPLPPHPKIHSFWPILEGIRFFCHKKQILTGELKTWGLTCCH